MDNFDSAVKYRFDLTQDKEDFLNENPDHVKYMLEYKITRCRLPCEYPCLQAHDGDILRRKPQRLHNGCWNYIPQECLSKEHCEYKSKCMFAHNPIEIQYHPMVYKTIPCGYPFVQGSCSKFGQSCPLAHGDKRVASSYSIETEVIVNEFTKVGQIEANKNNLENYSTYKQASRYHFQASFKGKADVFELATFKTRKCEKKIQHNERTCLGFHIGTQDRRRAIFFNSEACKYVYDKNLKEFINGECPNGDGCRSAHTLNEILYHKNYYKTAPCSSKPCDLGDCCPFIHNKVTGSIKDLELELNALKEKCRMNQMILDDRKIVAEKLMRFVCVMCGQQPFAVLQCGHMVCEKCRSQKCCGVKKRPLNIVFRK